MRKRRRTELSELGRRRARLCYAADEDDADDAADAADDAADEAADVAADDAADPAQTAAERSADEEDAWTRRARSCYLAAAQPARRVGRHKFVDTKSVIAQNTSVLGLDNTPLARQA